MTFSDELLNTLLTSEEHLSRQLVHDVEQIFATMVGVGGLHCSPIEMEAVTRFENSISSLVGLAGMYTGMVSLHMPIAFAAKVTGLMLKKDVTEEAESVNDAICEIANMIAGSVKNQLSSSGMDICVSMPSAIEGRQYSISLGHKSEQFALRFTLDDGWFVVAVAIGRD